MFLVHVFPLAMHICHSFEFEQIKNYVQGDDIRTVNWKATSRRNELMVNQYQDERAQHVYSIIDKSRSMRMPFNELTLLDYSINSTLAFSNICLRKGDKVGLMTFSDKLGTKIGYAVATALWSVAAIAHAAATSTFG